MVLRAHFLGGADEVGASCLLVEAGGRRILVDAGIRMGARASDRLPDLARISDMGDLDAILVTHAHLDHSGALPLVHGPMPQVPLVTTSATLELLKVLLLDAIKVMEIKSEAEDEIPLYPKAAVESLLARSIGVRFLEPVPLCDGELRATFFPAGHVLGAAAVGLETPEGNVLITGDVSLTDQLTVPGMPRPAFSPDLMVCESTYGARLHASRRAEESRLAQAVLEAVGDGGKVLIPSFALGRAQEVILVLRKALAHADAPKVSVYVDGMVRAVCGIYSRLPDFLSPRLRERAASDKGLFYTADGRIRPVETPIERETIAGGEPAIIVSSSGMLSGGASVQYAAHLAGDPKALIAITGYQDEEAPGRRLQEVERGERDELVLGGQATKVKCRVRTFGLSAHADAQELAGLAAAIRPGSVALVHGDQEARQGLAKLMSDSGVRQVHLPRLGESLEVARSTRRRSRPRIPGIGGGRPFDVNALAELHELLVSKGWPPRRAYSVRDLAEEWYGTAELPVDLGPVRAVLDSEQPHFVADYKRPFVYRRAERTEQATEAPAPAKSPKPKKGKKKPKPKPRKVFDKSGRMEMNLTFAEVDLAFADLPHRPLKKSKKNDHKGLYLELSFVSPEVGHRYTEVFEAISQKTKWRVEVGRKVGQPALLAAARELLPESWQLREDLALDLAERQVVLELLEPPPDDELQAFSSTLEEQTGFKVALK